MSAAERPSSASHSSVFVLLNTAPPAAVTGPRPVLVFFRGSTRGAHMPTTAHNLSTHACWEALRAGYIYTLFGRSLYYTLLGQRDTVNVTWGHSSR